MRVGSARATEHVAALQLLFQHRPPGDALAAVRAAQDVLAADADGSVRLLVARRDGVIVGAALVEKLPGATGVIWPPCAGREMPDAPEIEDALTANALSWLQRLGAKVVQSVLASNDALLAAPLLRAGFARVTNLLSLRVETCPLDVDDAFQSYDQCAASDFHDALMRSFQGGQDFPELSGRRTLKDVLHGYQEPAYGTRRWWLRRSAGQAAGVLMLTEPEPGFAMDLAYIGVVPERRRCGHGHALVRKAIAEAHAAGAETLTVSVDARNEPALALYMIAGFREFDRREVYLWLD